MFHYHNNELSHTANDKTISLQKLIKLNTEPNAPFLVYSENILTQNITNIKDAFQNHSNLLIAYSVKSLNNQHILKLIKKQNIGTDCVSGNEIKKALLAGIPANKIIFAGVGKTDDEIELAISNQIAQINAESCEELEVLDAIAKKLNLTQRVALRVNPHMEEEKEYTHSKITTGKIGNKFGIDLTQIPQALQILKNCPNLNLVGLSCHVGSQITDLEIFNASFTKIVDLTKDIINTTDFKLETLDFGGGVGVKYHNSDPKPISWKDYSASIIKKIKTLPQNLKIIIEPGRSISATTGILCSKIIFIKKGESKTFSILNAGMNNLLRPALYNSYHEIIPLIKNETQCTQKKENDLLTLSYSKKCSEYDFVGPICESSDIFIPNKKFQTINRNDFVAILNAGAYCSSMSLTYNDKPKAEEFLITSSSKIVKI